MWHDNPSLREVVVLDPVKYFVKPATRIVCDITPASADGRYHRQQIHGDCEKHHIKDFKMLQEEGLISENLLRFMLMYSTTDSIYDQELHYGMLKNLMLKYSLLVAVTLKSTENLFYAVPALLPTQSAGTKFDASKDYYDHTFYFAFQAGRAFTSNRNNQITHEELKKEGFLPNGLFQHLTSRVLSWITEEGSILDNYTLNKVSHP